MISFKVKHIVDKDILKDFSPRKMEKIEKVIPTDIKFEIEHEGLHLKIKGKLYYCVIMKGFLSKKKEKESASLGTLTLHPSELIDKGTKEIKRDLLRQKLEQYISNLGL